MNDGALPEPPLPADADLRHFPTMPLHVQRLRDSELASVPDAEVRWAALMSWCAAWHQVPAGSLPDDDVALCRLLGYGRDLRRWRPLRAKGALRGWYRAADGRLYHPVVTEMALESIAKSTRQRRNIMGRWGAQASENKRLLGYHGNTSGDAAVIPRKEGKGIEGIDNPSPSLRSGEGSSPSPAGDGDPPPPDEAEGKPPRQPPHPPEQTLLDMAAVWNALAAEHGLPQVRELSDKRRQQLRARCRERWTSDPVRQFRAYVTRICQSAFLTGGGSRGWRADFDWALQPRNVVAVAEGKYHDGEAGDR